MSYPGGAPVTLVGGAAGGAGAGTAANPLIVGGGAGKQESFALATNNTASAAVTVYGGDYIFSQVGSGYGTVALQVLGPDGTTWMTMASYTSSDTTGGHGTTLGSNAQVRVQLSGTTGVYALLTRVP